MIRPAWESPPDSAFSGPAHANDPKSFSAACVKLIEDPQFGTAIAENAWRNYLTNWTWNSTGCTFEIVVEQCLASGRDYDVFA